MLLHPSDNIISHRSLTSQPSSLQGPKELGNKAKLPGELPRHECPKTGSNSNIDSYLKNLLLQNVDEEELPWSRDDGLSPELEMKFARQEEGQNATGGAHCGHEIMQSLLPMPFMQKSIW